MRIEKETAKAQLLITDEQLTLKTKHVCNWTDFKGMTEAEKLRAELAVLDGYSIKGFIPSDDGIILVMFDLQGAGRLAKIQLDNGDPEIHSMSVSHEMIEDIQALGVINE